MNLREPEPSSFSAVLNRYLRLKGYTRHGAEVLAAVLWPQAVGPWYSRHTEVIRVENGVVTIHCDSAPLAQQLVADSDKILSRLNRMVAHHLAAENSSGSTEPPPVLREIRATTAYQGRSRPYYAPHQTPVTPRPRPGEIESLPLTPEEEAYAQDLATQIDDENVRRRFLAALRSSLRLRHWQRAQGWHPCPTCDCLLPPEQSTCLFCNPPPAPPQVRE